MASAVIDIGERSTLDDSEIGVTVNGLAFRRPPRLSWPKGGVISARISPEAPGRWTVKARLDLHGRRGSTEIPIEMHGDHAWASLVLKARVRVDGNPSLRISLNEQQRVMDWDAGRPPRGRWVLAKFETPDPRVKIRFAVGQDGSMGGTVTRVAGAPSPTLSETRIILVSDSGITDWIRLSVM